MLGHHMRNMYTHGSKPDRRNLTVADLRAFKGTRFFSQVAAYSEIIHTPSIWPGQTSKMITGMAQVGETLTATIGTIDDADGLPTGTFPAGYDFQWVRVDASDNETDIGTNSSTYTLVAADAGKTFKVKVRFTDDAGYSEGPLTSNEYPASTAQTGDLQLVDDDDRAPEHRVGLRVMARW